MKFSFVIVLSFVMMLGCSWFEDKPKFEFTVTGEKEECFFVALEANPSIAFNFQGRRCDNQAFVSKFSFVSRSCNSLDDQYQFDFLLISDKETPKFSEEIFEIIDPDSLDHYPNPENIAISISTSNSFFQEYGKFVSGSLEIKLSEEDRSGNLSFSLYGETLNNYITIAEIDNIDASVYESVELCNNSLTLKNEDKNVLLSNAFFLNIFGGGGIKREYYFTDGITYSNSNGLEGFGNYLKLNVEISNNGREADIIGYEFFENADFSLNQPGQLTFSGEINQGGISCINTNFQNFSMNTNEIRGCYSGEIKEY